MTKIPTNSDNFKVILRTGKYHNPVEMTKMPSEFELRRKMKKLRNKLCELTRYKSLVDPEVIAVSQKLDAVVNEYYRSVWRAHKK